MTIKRYPKQMQWSKHRCIHESATRQSQTHTHTLSLLRFLCFPSIFRIEAYQGANTTALICCLAWLTVGRYGPLTCGRRDVARSQSYSQSRQPPRPSSPFRRNIAQGHVVTHVEEARQILLGNHQACSCHLRAGRNWRSLCQNKGRVPNIWVIKCVISHMQYVTMAQ